MAFIRCGTGGGSGAEIIEGTIYGTTNVGAEFTVTSQKGKTPKLATIWLSSNDTGATAVSECMWRKYWFPNKSIASYSSSPATLNAGTNNIGAVSNYNPTIKSVGADSITFKINNVNTYCKGTFTYHVEFE